jgi:hypothetical protein
MVTNFLQQHNRENRTTTNINSNPMASNRNPGSFQNNNNPMYNTPYEVPTMPYMPPQNLTAEAVAALPPPGTKFFAFVIVIYRNSLLTSFCWLSVLVL